MIVIEMSEFSLRPAGGGQGIREFDFALAQGDVCAVEAQNPDDAHGFLRALATLDYPVKGMYRFMGQVFNLKNYKELLCCKKRMAYIASDSALISNLTIKQNILIHRYYHENDLNIDLDDKLKSMCDTFGIRIKLDRRPADLNSMERQMAIVIREIAKDPDLLLIERPEDFIGHARSDVLIQIFNDWIKQRKPVAFISFDRRLIRRFATRRILIANGVLTEADVRDTVGND